MKALKILIARSFIISLLMISVSPVIQAQTVIVKNVVLAHGAVADRPEIQIKKSTPEQNKALVLKAFDAAFNKREDSAFERYWSPDYVQHSAHIPPGRDGLRKLIASTPPNMKYEHGLIMAEGDFVMVHGRFSNLGLPAAWVTLDIVRIENGLLVEHWDVIQDEVSKADSKSGKPMFGDSFVN